MYAHLCLEGIAFRGDCSGPTVITPLTTECQVHRAGGSAPLKPVSPLPGQTPRTHSHSWDTGNPCPKGSISRAYPSSQPFF